MNYDVCQRTVIRISNEYRKGGDEAFSKKKPKERREETLNEKVKRLELENEILRMFQKELMPYAKKSNIRVDGKAAFSI